MIDPFFVLFCFVFGFLFSFLFCSLAFWSVLVEWERFAEWVHSMLLHPLLDRSSLTRGRCAALHCSSDASRSFLSLSRRPQPTATPLHSHSHSHPPPWLTSARPPVSTRCRCRPHPCRRRSQQCPVESVKQTMRLRFDQLGPLRVAPSERSRPIADCFCRSLPLVRPLF